MGMSGIKLRTTTTQIECKLKPEELLNHGSELANVLQSINAEEDRKKSFNEQVKSVITELESKRNKLSNLIRSRAEFRDIDVDFIMLDDATVKEVRLDTGDTLIVRPARPEESQLALQMFEQREAKAQAEQGVLEVEKTSTGSNITETPEGPTPEATREVIPIQNMPHSEIPPEVLEIAKEFGGEVHKLNWTPEEAKEIIKGQSEADKLFASIPSGSEQAEPEKPSKLPKKAKTVISSFVVKIAQGTERHILSCNGITVKNSTLKAGVMDLFKQLGETADNPRAMVNSILKKYPPCSERNQVINILETGEMLAEGGNN